MDNTYELWLWITLGMLLLVALGAMLSGGNREWDHLETCKKTRQGMARMINRD